MDGRSRSLWEGAITSPAFATPQWPRAPRSASRYFDDVEVDRREWENKL